MATDFDDNLVAILADPAEADADSNGNDGLRELQREVRTVLVELPKQGHERLVQRLGITLTGKWS
jgi:hypothetical protein